MPSMYRCGLRRLVGGAAQGRLSGPDRLAIVAARVRHASMGLAGTLLVVLTAGCDANFYSIFRTTNLESGTTPITDAQQRLVVNLPYREDEKARDRPIKPVRLICAEPSPDVAQAIAFAVKASGALDTSKNPTQSPATSLSASGALSVSGASAIAQLGERLAVIQLLRDKMYRACEAYANGASDRTSYVLMLARLDKTMATLLAAEMAAGAFGRALAAAGGSSSSGGVDAGALAKAREAVTKAGEGLKAAALVEDDAARKTKVEAATKEFNDAVTVLTKTEFQLAQTSAQASAATPGAISGTTMRSAAEVAMIHQNYLDDDGLEPLIDACISRLSTVGLPPDAVEKMKLVQEQETKVTRARVVRGPLVDELDRRKNDYNQDVLAAGGPFALFCIQHVLSGETKDNKHTEFVKMRLDQKLKLRKASVDLATVNMCSQIVAAYGAGKNDMKTAALQCTTFVRAVRK